MPRISIDDQDVDVPTGATILDAARKLGIHIPTLCFLEGYPPNTSCMVCMVKVSDPPKLVPACGTIAVDGMRVENATEEVRRARRMALELLLGDHAGDCYAPCQSICPAHMDIPTMIRQISAGRFQEAVATVKLQIALPAVLGRICSKPCEKGCRRSEHGGAVSVCLLKQSVADADIEAEEPYLPEREEPTGKRVAVIGSGPTGLAAAYYLLREGHACTVFDDHPEPGGMLRYAVEDDRLPRSVLDGEIASIRRLGAEFRLGVRVGRDVSLEEIQKTHDALLVATGELDAAGLEALGFPGATKGVQADRHTFQTPWTGVFAGGGVLRKSRLAVRSVAEGRAAAASIVQYLRGEPVRGPAEPFNHRLLSIAPIEVTRMSAQGSAEARTAPAAGAVRGFSLEEARREASRCVGCDCRKVDDCRLRIYAEEYGAEWNRFRGDRRQVEIQVREGGVVFEVGKCISCGICIAIAARAKERLGLSYIGRGFKVRLGVPFNRPFSEGLEKVAAECVRACPTGAIAFAERAEAPPRGLRLERLF